jgi:hypothetical protein
MKKRHLLAVLFLSIYLPTTAQTLVSANKIKSYTVGELILSGIFSAENEVDLYHIIYNTIDPQGNSTIASGALAVPILINCDSFPLLNYNHGTVLGKDEVPSRLAGEEFVGLASASQGYVATMPDYLGLGDSPGFHPYQHAESEATATIDMIRASRSFVQDSLGIHFNGQVFLTGYSQGGHAAMATHKFIEDNGLTTEFNIVVSAPASGAYDMSETTADFIFSNAYSNPGYIVYLIEAYQTVYGNLYTSRADYYRSPYDTVILPYLNGSSSMAQLNAVLPQQIDSLIEDSVLVNYVADSVSFTYPLRMALRANDVYDWAPVAEVLMNYCEADEQVPYQNSIKAETMMKGNGATKVTAVSRGASFDHGSCVLPTLAAVQTYLNGFTKKCVMTTGIAQYELDAQTKVYPNPAKSNVTIEMENNTTSMSISLIGSDGRTLLERIHPGGKLSLSLSNYPSGLYLLRIQHNNDQVIRKLLIE